MARATTKTKQNASAREMVERIKSTIDDPALVERRRAQITKAAIVAFSRNGFHASTIRGVAKQAKVSVGLIYQYIGDKEDLLFMALVGLLRAYREQIPPAVEGVVDPFQRFNKIVRSYCKVHGASTEATVLAYRETASLNKERRNVIKQLEVETNQLIIDAIQDCIRAGVFEEDIDVDLFCYQIVMFSQAWALKAWHFKSRMSIETYLERGLRLMLGGVMTAKGLRQYRALLRNEE